MKSHSQNVEDIITLEYMRRILLNDMDLQNFFRRRSGRVSSCTPTV